MRFSRLSAVFVLSLGSMFLRSTQSSKSPITVTTVGPCSEFATEPEDIELAWTLNGCIEVWTQFVNSIRPKYNRRWPYVDTWSDTATKLRAAGTPCLAGSIPSRDGVGSSIIKLLASWILAEELGCDWVTPSWENGFAREENSTHTIMYCHSTVFQRHGRTNVVPAELERSTSCSAVNWTEYFQFGVASVTLPKGKNIKAIKVSYELHNYVCMCNKCISRLILRCAMRQL